MCRFDFIDFFLFWSKEKLTVTLEFELKSTQDLGRWLPHEVKLPKDLNYLEDLYVPIICPNIELKLEGESWVFFTKLDFTSNINFIKWSGI